MRNGWWLIPSVIGGACIWGYAGWSTYKMLRGPPHEEAKMPSAVREGTDPVVAEAEETTDPSL